MRSALASLLRQQPRTLEPGQYRVNPVAAPGATRGTAGPGRTGLGASGQVSARAGDDDEARSDEMTDLPEVTPDLEDEIDAVAALKDPVRRALFLYVDCAGDDVSRDEAAKAAGISRALAAFHLDKLVEEGLLDATFRRLNGKAGPGAGRPSKLYRRSERELSLTLPAREYELAARLLARAMESGADPRAALAGIARDAGR